jgi:hypothetical protein
MSCNRTERLRRSALECLELAKTTTDDRAKQTLIRLADVWTKLMHQRFLVGQLDGLVEMLDTTPVPREAGAVANAD